MSERIDTIPTSYEVRYWLRRPIPVEFEDVGPDAVIAHFHEAELAMTGSDRQDAKASLALWIFNVFDYFTDLAAANPQVLGRTPALQIRVLKEYIGLTGRRLTLTGIASCSSAGNRYSNAWRGSDATQGGTMTGTLAVRWAAKVAARRWLLGLEPRAKRYSRATADIKYLGRTRCWRTGWPT